MQDEPEYVNLNLPIREMCLAAECCGPFVVGMMKCRLCGHMEKTMKVLGDEHPLDELTECGNCGLIQSKFMDLRDHTWED